MNDDNDPKQQQAMQDPWAMTRPYWDQWKTVRRAPLWKAVALLCDIAPKHFESTFYPGKLETMFKRYPQKFTNLLTLAKNSLGSGSLKPVSLDAEHLEESVVELTTFATWANSTGVKLPQGFPWQPEMQLPINGWPWGSYDTALLRKLALAADQFWKRYDPANPSSAPTNQAVIDWLKEHEVSDRIAEIMATILRADDLPPGPRK